jgi:uncharacterized membrane protein
MLAHWPVDGRVEVYSGRVTELRSVRVLAALPYTLAALAAAGYASAAIFRHDHFGSNAYDLGIFDQTIWGYSRFEVVENTVLRVPNALGDHFHQILVALAPLYWIWDDARVLLLAQAALLALAGVPIFLWARRVLGVLPALGFEAAYLAFWAVLGGSIFDFHELAVAAPVVSFALYAVLTERTGLLLGMTALGLLTREDLALTFTGIGVYLVLVQRRWRLGAALVAVSAAWFVVMFKWVIPALAGSGRSYSHWTYTGLGSGPGSALWHLVAHPIDSVKLFFTPREKVTALLNLFVPWLGLPLVSPLLIVMLPTLGARFFSDKPSHWAPQGFHYSLVLAPMLAFAAVDTAARLARLTEGRRGELTLLGLTAGVLWIGLYFSFLRLKPLDELGRYTTRAQIAVIEDCLETIPVDASVSATSALVPHLSHRKEIYVLDRRPLPDTDYYALDASTWIFPLTGADVELIAAERRRAGYDVVCEGGPTTILSRRGT